MNGYLVWDFDDTLACRDGRWSGALAQAAAVEGVEVDVAVLKPFLREGFPWHDPEGVRRDESAECWWARLEALFTTAFRDGVGMAEDAAARTAARVNGIYRDPAGWEVFGDVPDALRALSEAGWKHVILSNHIPELDGLVEQLGLSHYFERIFSSGITGVEKPHAGAYGMVGEHVGGAGRMIMIGDSWGADVLGAASVGWESILVRKEHPEARHACLDLLPLPGMLGSGERFFHAGAGRIP